ncbi:MAG: hypothetical protein J0L99_01825 [Chitinophagales bacterium]|nr:hypothetical protein [Chitinophagales bacterium]
MAARLTTFSRLLITLAILAGVYFLATKFIIPRFGNPGNTEVTATNGNNSGTADPSANPVVGGGSNSGASSSSWGKGSGSYTPTPFNFTPTAPSGGKLKGVVELGAQGFNSFIIQVDAQKNWSLKRAEYGASLVYESLATDDDVKAGLKRYIADMLSFGVSPKEIHFVISSGAKKVPVTEKISAELKRMGYFVNEVTPEQEGRLALKAAMPQAFSGTSFVVDIGSGNTKISWLPSAALEAPGAKYFQNNTPDQQVYDDVFGKAKQVPGNLRNTCFIIGGVPYDLAKTHRNGKERYTVLKAPADYNAGDNKKTASGLNILRAVADATGCRQFVFDWDANFTIGFLLNLP